MRSQQRLSSVRATAYRHDAHNDQRAAVTPAAQADARYEAQAAETMTASRRVRQCFAGGSVAAAGKMLYLQPDKIIIILSYRVVFTDFCTSKLTAPINGQC